MLEWVGGESVLVLLDNGGGLRDGYRKETWCVWLLYGVITGKGRGGGRSTCV